MVSDGVKRDQRWLFWGLALGMFLLDQAVKAWARHTFGLNLNALEGKPFPGFFELTLTYNEGIAFGMFQGHGILLAPVAVGMSLAAGWYSWRHPSESALSHAAMGLLAAGAIGNLFDRLALHHVTDMFYFRAIGFPVFNVADACITVAAILLIISWSFQSAGKVEAPAAEQVAPGS